MTDKTATNAGNVGYIGHSPYVRQTFPGQPIEVCVGGEPYPLSDSQALFLAYQLLQCLMGNEQSKVRANADRA
jgi:hypothetical protein